MANNKTSKKRNRQREQNNEKKVPDTHRQAQQAKPSSTVEQTKPLPLKSLVIKSNKRFLNPDDKELPSILESHYHGFSHIPATQIEASFHRLARQALENLRDAGYYQYDMVMAGGKNLSRTFVRRTLVGNPGITYKYLGLRLFAHAWSGPSASAHLREIRAMNDYIVSTTKEEMHRQCIDENKSCCEYNLTLINYMEPTNSELALKEEEHYGMGKVAVSWHADSSLEPNSCIGVYHCLPTQKAKLWDWKIALRPNPDQTSNHTPPLVLPTTAGDMYFMLGDFNDKHQHMVLAGSTAYRISSTHRVAVTENDTYDYILQRVKNAKKKVKRELKKQSPREWNKDILIEGQKVLTEVEFEWIAQYWVQGVKHDEMHIWWQEPMRELERQWLGMELQTFQIYQACAQRQTLDSLVDAFLGELQVRQELRDKWDERRSDKAYKRRMERYFQPVEHPIFCSDDRSLLPKDLSKAIRKLSELMGMQSNEHGYINHHYSTNRKQK